MRGIFFIVGTGRCGTNLCQQILNLHPDIKVATETHFIPTLVRQFGNNPISLQEFVNEIEEHYTSYGRKWIDVHLEATSHNPSCFHSEFADFCLPNSRRTVREFVEAFLEFCYGEGTYLLGDKTPQYGIQMKELAALWPQAKFIHMIRDGRYAATSIQKHMGLVRLVNAGFPDKITEYSYKGAQIDFSTDPVNLLDCVRWWGRMVDLIRQESANISPSAYLEVHYERLLLHPIQELSRIARFLDVPVTLRWLVKALQIPRSFSLWSQGNRISNTEYTILTSEAHSVLRELGYSTRSYRAQHLERIIHGMQELINWIAIQVVVARLIQVRTALSSWF
jgi:hypothetical protein